ncbi:hypothetical protein OIU79_025212 [Salix purpurea]|uniref:Uncharacterized protein n=1 Tax=Salix purpurea TaxID=77065 RepID=A0A9Q0W440_SALPP|nr:hypothetical protein OIU79_025212 [Salix purpurea]
MEKGGLGTKVSFSYQLSTFSQRAAGVTTATDSGRAPGGSGCLPRWSKPAPKLLAFRNVELVRKHWDDAIKEGKKTLEQYKCGRDVAGREISMEPRRYGGRMFMVARKLYS